MTPGEAVKPDLRLTSGAHLPKLAAKTAAKKPARIAAHHLPVLFGCGCAVPHRSLSSGPAVRHILLGGCRSDISAARAGATPAVPAPGSVPAVHILHV